MSNPGLKERLIEKIKHTDDPALLQEISNLVELQEPETIYVLHEKQKQAVQDAKQQIRNKESFSNEEADKKIDEWLDE